MAKANILVVDSDEGFGFMLKEGLQNSGQYTAKCVHTGGDALQTVVEEAFDLVIIDMALTDMLGDLPDLINEATGQRKSAAQARPALPVTPPAKPASLPPSSPPPTKSASPPPAAPAVAPTPAPAAVESAIVVDETSSLTFITVPQQTIRFMRANEAEILRLLDDLNREVRAEAILLIAGLELIAQAGMLSRPQCQELTLLVAQSSQAAAQAASFLGERAGRFAQSLHEGSEYRLYSLSLGEGILLSLALSSNVPLGMIRHQCRQTADQLGKFII
ncbi:MAG: hypothetical protein HYR94_15875 [Chloroflexi bacterium]|nr:hypothetical protein [Chloroflexota bacterium]